MKKYITAIAFVCSFSGCGNLHSLYHYPNFIYQKDKIETMRLITDVFVIDNASANPPIVDLKKNFALGKILVDSLVAKLNRKGYSITKKYPSAIAHDTEHKLYTIIGRQDSSYQVYPPFFMPIDLTEDSVVAKGIDLFNKRDVKLQQRLKDSTAFTKPINVLLIITARGQDVSTGKKIAMALLGNLSKTGSNAYPYYYITLLMIDADSGEQLLKDISYPEHDSPTTEGFLNSLEEIIKPIPPKNMK